MTEKHQALLQMYNKESKVNKRLSMDREQLMWRLTQECQSQPPTPELFSRSASQQVLTKSAPVTPSFTGNAVAVGSSTPWYRPLSQTDFSSFGPEDFIHEDSNDNDKF